MINGVYRAHKNKLVDYNGLDYSNRSVSCAQKSSSLKK